MKSILILLGMILVTQPIFSAELATANPNIEIVRSDNDSERQKAMRELLIQRAADIHKLMGILEGNSPLQVRLDAANALGSLRAVEAVNSLVDNIELDYQPRAITGGGVTKQELEAQVWPVSTALARIGSPAIPALTEKLASSDDAKITGKCVSILSTIYGYDIAKVRLQSAYQAEQNQERKARLREALQLLEENQKKQHSF